MMTPVERIEDPGLYRIAADIYHADPCPDPSLSSGVARLLVDASPRHAWTAHPRLNPEAGEEREKRTDFGSAAHAMLLGEGRELAIIDAPDYRAKAAKQAREEAYEAGKTPILIGDHAEAEAMVRAARQQIEAIPEVGVEFAAGQSEAVVAWRDSGLWCRAMVDRLTIADGRAFLIDYKTTDASAHPAAVSRRLYEAGYDFQAAFYRRGLAHVLPDIRRFGFALITQEKRPPYALSAVTMDGASWVLAEKRIVAALGLWRRCLSRDEWPAYPAAVATAELPAWHESRWIEREATDAMLAEIDHDFAWLADLHRRPSEDEPAWLG